MSRFESKTVPKCEPGNKHQQKQDTDVFSWITAASPMAPILVALVERSQAPHVLDPFFSICRVRH
ncbi:hypothetical protein B0H67DRAFT_18762 [Lasiosphaeris hirsuta]|uniref:Uncharacterized protein n=1 Tax=Lasiosphaeris hirsuta TaxID=260670 RepID=A0AA40B9B7_9PEZI|nr:hypothetical protein B0H67DRAFT_18762 [Lasiosphaeris hirsuta]